MADRRTRFLVLRVVASLLMLGVLVPRIHLGSLLPEWTAATGAWLLAALAATALAVVLSALRWQAVLAGLGLHERAPTLLNHYLAGEFVGNFLPSTIGGDVLRMRRLAATNGASADTFASIVLERLTGWVILPFLTLIALGANPGLRELGSASTLAATVALATLGLLTILLVAVAHPRLGGRWTSDAGWQRLANAVHLGVDRFRHQPSAAAGVLVTGFAYQGAVVLAVFLAARALDIDHVGLTATFAFFPAVAIVQVMPFTVGGLGLREWALVLFLDPLGVSASRAIALGLLVYGLKLAVSLLGAPSFAIGTRAAKLPGATRGLRWWRELLLILAFYGVYSVIRNQFGSEAVSPGRAFDNARTVIDIERAIGTYHEETVQEWFLGARWFIQFWNLFYGTFHFVVTTFCIVWLFKRFPERYVQWRTTLACTTALALIGFSLYPLMPPRLLPASYGFVDTLRDYGGLWSFDSGAMQRVSNQYAAMPSLHFGWSTWCALVLIPTVRRPSLKVLAGLYPALTLFAIVVTGNHYWIDAAGGAAILGVGHLAGRWWAVRSSAPVEQR